VLGAVTSLGLTGCITDMFDPAGGRYAENRYSDPYAFELQERRPGPEATIFVFQAKKPAARVWLRSVYLEGPNGKRPRVDYTLSPDGRVVVTVPQALLAEYDRIFFFGGYKSPELAIKGARSVEIITAYRF
jgi:hypothetical protein